MKLFFILLWMAITTMNSVYGQVPVIQYQQVATGLSVSVDIANAHDASGRLFIVQQSGQVRIWDGSSLLSANFLDVSSKIIFSGERGLLSMAFHPDYKNNRYFFIYYTKTGSGDLTIARYRTLEGNPNLADANSGVEILTIPHSTNGNHNGGKLNFGSDGYLYLGTGDGGGSNDQPNNAQNGNSLLGKMLRIDVNDFADATPPLYAIPSTNPYTSDVNVNDAIIALGLRNPFRWSFDRSTGDMWIGDVGQGAREEIDVRSAATISTLTNYGWRCIEGLITNPNPAAACPEPANYVEPIFDYGHNSATGGYALTGGIVYRGPEYASLNGYYICTDFVTGNIWLTKNDGINGYVTSLQTQNKVLNIAAFGEAEDGKLYAVRLSDGVSGNTGVLYKIITDAVLPLKIISFNGMVQGTAHYLQWKISRTNPGDEVVLERKANNETDFSELFRKAAQNEVADRYLIQAVDYSSFYRLKIISTAGTVLYSKVISIHANDEPLTSFTAYLSGGYIKVQLAAPASFVELYDGAGKVYYKKNMSGQSGLIEIPVSNLSKGVKYLRVYSGKNSEVKKLIW